MEAYRAVGFVAAGTLAAAAALAQAPALVRTVFGEPAGIAGPAADHGVRGPASSAASRFPVFADGAVAVMVELEEEPAVHVWARERTALRAAGLAGAEVGATARTREQLREIDQSQQSLVAMLGAPDIGARVIYHVQRVYNGIAIQVDPAMLGLIASLPGVKAVHPLAIQRRQNASAIPLIGAPQVWSAAGLDVRGDGVTIGIIDTGIDYIHTDFGGSGNYAGQVYDDNTVPWTAKVVGGYDFAGDSYDAGGDTAAQRTPHPDGDPMDCEGHGTHVAGSAAGYGVTASGATYAGPYGPGADLDSLRIGPGVAPGAELYALKIFGCSGTTALTTRAIEWAVDPNADGDFSDHLDVINMSLGSDFGTGDDDTALAADSAAMAGVLVACSAGNSGDTTYVVGTPSTASRALSVASSVDSTSITSGFVVTAPGSIAGTYPSVEAGFGPDLGTIGDRSGSLAYPSSDRNACTAFGPAVAAELSGKVALVDRGACTFETKVFHCQQAGAAAAIVADNVAGDPFQMAEDPTLNVTISIPSILTTRSVGATLAGASATSVVTVTLTASLRNTVRIVDLARVDMLSSFSSRGPRIGNTDVKPDVTAPGDTIFSAEARSGNQGVSLSGTSMASPMVAGSLALLRQLHPTWTVEEIKALLMNTADHDLYVGADHGLPIYGPARVGAGRIDDAAAANSGAIAYATDVPGQVGIMFGAPEVLGSTALSRNVRLANKGGTAKTFSVGSELAADTPGVAFSFPDGDTVTVPPGGVASIRVQMTGDAAQMRHTRAPAVAATQDSQARSWMSEEAGFVTLTPAAGTGDQPLRLPVYASPRPASVMTTTEGQVNVSGATSSGSLHLNGAAIHTGSSYPTDIVSLASAFELQIIDPDEPIIAVGDNWADIAYVGVASDYPARAAAGGGLADTVIEFAIVAYGDWSTPGQTSFRIDIDSDSNGTTDYQLFAETSGDLVENGTPTDVFVSALCPASGGGTCYTYPLDGLPPDVMDTAVFNTNVMVLPVRAARLGLSAASPRFSYTVHSFDTLDTTSRASFDPTAPGLALYGASTLPMLYLDLDGATIPFSYDQARYAANGSEGALVIHHFNPAGMRAQVLDVVSNACSLTCTASVPGSVTIGEYATFQASAGTAGCGGSAVYDWDFGDGSPHASSASATHAFAAAGSYAWKLTVSSGGNTCRHTGVINALSASAGPAYLIGGVAHNAGELGSQWRTGVAIVNRSGAAADLTLTYFGSAETVQRSLTLASGEATAWTNVVEQLFGLAPSVESQGTLRLDSDVDVYATARTYNQSSAGTFGQYMPALKNANAITAGQTGVLPGLKKNADFRTNVGFVNLGASSCPVVVTLFDATGARLGSAVTFTADGGRWSQQNDIFAKLGAPGVDLAYATVETTSSQCRVWAYASVTDNATQDPTTIPLLVSGGTAVAAASRPGSGDLAAVPTLDVHEIAAIAHNPGVEGSQWRSDVVMVDLSAQAASVTLTYYPTGGAAIARSATLPAGASIEWRNVLETLFGLAPTDESQGTLQIASNVELFITGRTYNQSATGTFGQYLPALTAVDGIAAGQTGVLPRLENNADFRTNVGAVDLDGPPSDVVVTLYDQNGGVIGSPVTLTVPSGRWLQQSDIFKAAGHPVADVDVAYATVEVVTPGTTVWFYASVADNRTNDPTTIPVLF